MSKTFTQEDVNKIVADRIAKEKTKFDKQLTTTTAKLGALGFENFEQVKTLKDERDSYKSQFDELKNTSEKNEKRSSILKLGVDEQFVDFILEKSNDVDFAGFIEANPKFKAENFNKGGSNPNYQGVTDLKSEELKKM